ncbi:MAG: BrnA antitoxin family protein [Acidobacteriaceae bacterium]
MKKHIRGKIVRSGREARDPFSAKERKELAMLAKMPDSEIDTSDIPELPLEYWKEHGVIGRFYRPIKKPVTLRLDADVIDWLKEEGKGYQTRANHLLRREMLAQRRRPTKAGTKKQQRKRVSA